VSKLLAIPRNARLVRNLLKKQQHLPQTDVQTALKDNSLVQVKRQVAQFRHAQLVNNQLKMLQHQLQMDVQIAP
jgi:hypothetical protein